MVRRGQSLFARVEWTPEAQQLIKSKQYRFFSPEFTPKFASESGDSEGFTILAGGLTNRPFLRGMTPVALNQDVVEYAFSRFAEVPDTQPMASDTKKETAAPKSEKDEKAPATEKAETVTMSQADHDALRSRADERDQLKGEIDKLTSRLDEVDKELETERFSADFSQALREGRVDAKDETRSTWRGRYEKFGRSEAKALLFELPAETIAMSERGSGADANPAEDAPEGVDGERYAMDAAIKKVAADKDVDYAEAAMIVAEQASA
jgi:hypothetical protein